MATPSCSSTLIRCLQYSDNLGRGGICEGMRQTKFLQCKVVVLHMYVHTNDCDLMHALKMHIIRMYVCIQLRGSSPRCTDWSDPTGVEPQMHCVEFQQHLLVFYICNSTRPAPEWILKVEFPFLELTFRGVIAFLFFYCICIKSFKVDIPPSF